MSKLALSLVAAGAALTAIAATPGPKPKHVVLTAGEVTWGAGPASLPPGAQSAVLYGDPTKEGPFALRLKFPKGYRIAPHTHPRPEIITVISGAFLLSTAADHGAHKGPLTAGSFVAMEPGLVHQAGADEETIVQLTSVGPWGIAYVNPSDDPRQRTH